MGVSMQAGRWTKRLMRTELISLSRSSLLRGFIAFFTSLKRSSVWMSSAKMLLLRVACCKLVWKHRTFHHIKASFES